MSGTLGLQRLPVAALLRQCMLSPPAACHSLRILPHAEIKLARPLISLRSFGSRTKYPQHEPKARSRSRTQFGSVHATAQQPQRRHQRQALPEMDRYYATCHPGLEQVVADELLSAHIGAAGANIGKAGVYFWCALPLCNDESYPRVALWSSHTIASLLQYAHLYLHT